MKQCFSRCNANFHHFIKISKENACIIEKTFLGSYNVFSVVFVTDVFKKFRGMLRNKGVFSNGTQVCNGTGCRDY